MPNNKGGKKYKRNKNVAQENKTTRLKDENDSQEYAQITKALGNCRFDVMCFDGKSRLATMCGKMRKRVFVNQGELVLVSLRDWQDSKCDIIEKYNPNDVQKFKKMKCIPDFIKLEETVIVEEDDHDNMGNPFTMDIPSDSSDEEEEFIDKKISSDESESDDDIDVDEI